MSALAFYIKVVKALEDLKAPYMIVGAFAGLAFGITRATFDVDILVDLRSEDFDALAARFPPPRYYADPEMMRESTRQGIMFNLIDAEEGVKADLVPLTREPDYRAAFGRRVRQILGDETGVPFEAWCAQPADIIVGKLTAWRQGRSPKHPADIYSMLVFSFSGLGDYQVEIPIVTTEAARLGSETLRLWQELVARAEQEVSKSKGTD